MSDTPPEPDEQTLALAESLRTRRPTPSPGFRGALARRLLALDAGYRPRPARLWIQVWVLAGAGTLLVLLGLLVSAGTI